MKKVNTSKINIGIAGIIIAFVIELTNLYQQETKNMLSYLWAKFPELLFGGSVLLIFYSEIRAMIKNHLSKIEELSNEVAKITQLNHLLITSQKDINKQLVAKGIVIMQPNSEAQKMLEKEFCDDIENQ